MTAMDVEFDMGFPGLKAAEDSMAGLPGEGLLRYDPDRLRKLWLAVLVENVNVALGFGARSSQVFSKRADLSQKSAELWLGSEDFDIICDLVGIDPGLVLIEVETLRVAGMPFEVEVWG